MSKIKYLIVFCTVVLASCLIVFSLRERYYYINAFYLEYGRGQKKAALKDFWASPGVSVKDLRAAGVKNISTDGDDPDVPKGYSFDAKNNGIQYFITGDSDGTVVSVDKENDDPEPTNMVVSSSPRYSKRDILYLGGANKKQLVQYRRFTYNFMEHVQKQTYEYWEKNKTLRYLKMIPYYEYLRKN